MFRANNNRGPKFLKWYCEGAIGASELLDAGGEAVAADGSAGLVVFALDQAGANASCPIEGQLVSSHCQICSSQQNHLPMW